MTAIRFRVLPRSRSQVEIDRQRRQISKVLMISLFVLPGMTLFTLFLLIPIGQSAVFSMYDWNGFGPLTNFVGTGNYERLFNHSIFHSALSHSFILMTCSVLIQLPIALGLALLVGRGSLPGRKIFRTILFVPFVFSEIITALIWLYVLHPQSGLMNTALATIIPDYRPIGWLGERSLVLYSIFAVLTWKYFGLYMILYMAGLQSVPRDLEDAARVDGATEWSVLRLITLPLMGSTIRLTVFLSVLGSFQQFVLVWVLTQGGPVNASELIATYLFKYGIQRFALGYGSAVAVVLFAITLVFSLGYQRIILRQDYSVDYT
ncbi:sugar ABC transporter permease [Anaerolineae bacterium CFX9]|jgi:raffinose/stachyose/melibiose transport system permease protein|nr:sugar ABC transporter permease [Anaerolineae bacterium CFX9]